LSGNAVGHPIDDRTPREIIASFRIRTGELLGDELAAEFIRFLEDHGLVIITRDERRRVLQLGGRYASAIGGSRREDRRGLGAIVTAIVLVGTIMWAVAVFWPR
jgi:hypothetical protein